MRPESESQLVEALRDAGGPVEVRGGGTRLAWRPVASDVLETGGLSGVRLYEPGAQTLVAGAGTPLAEIEALLAEKGQRLAFEPMEARALMGTSGTATLGGVIAANVAGPRRVQAGAARDFLLGVRFVDGAGRLVSNGGRVMKNVTGYDLVKMMAGSWGTLGVLSEVSLKVLAKPPVECTLILRGLDGAAGVARLCAAMGTPYDVTGTAHLDAGLAGEDSLTLVRIEGLPGSVAHRRRALLEGACAGCDSVEGEESAALWRAVRDVTPFAGRTGAVWQVSVKPTDAPRLLTALEAANLRGPAICDWSGGRLWLLLEESAAAAVALRTEVAALGGHATLMRASEGYRAGVPMFQPQAPGVARLAERLRATFDPRGVLNPGLMAQTPVGPSVGEPA